MPYVGVPGARLNVADVGRIEAPTLLFVHGNVMDLHMWDALVGRLEYEQAWLPQLIHQGGERVAKAISVRMDADDVTDRVGSIRHPALVIHGRRDIPIPFDRGEELARAVPGSGPIAGIDSAGHTPPVSHPEHTLEAVTRFLSS
jgi:3-oxoadipate enol-lactonase